MGKRLKDCLIPALSKEISSKVCKDLEDEGKQKHLDLCLMAYCSVPTCPTFLTALLVSAHSFLDSC